MASFKAETILNLGPLPITNSFITAIAVTIIIGIIAYFYSKQSSLIPNRFTSIIEYFVEYLYKSIEGIAGNKTKRFFPLCAAFFIYIILNNYFGLLPIVGPIGFTQNGDFIPLFRSINADINGTLVLALVSVVMTHYYAINYVGIYFHIARYFPILFLRPKDFSSFKKASSTFGMIIINSFVAILELISEFVKIISLSFRLFGNIFAGEVVLTTISGLFAFSAFLIPLPFMGLELIVGYVQATVFMLLTVVFMSVLSDKHLVENH